MIGIVFDSFIPLHQGHINLINRAIKENSKTIIAVCGYENDTGKDFIPFETRVELMKQKYIDDRNVIVVAIDHSKLKTDSLNEEFGILWINELFFKANMNPTEDYCWYVNNKEYAHVIHELYPKHKYIVIEDDVSCNIDNEKFKKYKSLIDKDFYCYLRNVHS